MLFYLTYKNKKFPIILRIFLFILLSIFSSFSFAFTKAKVAIIIDDIGYRATDLAALSLPNTITFSILPHTPYGKTLAEQAFSSNADIMLHIPMEAENGKFLGPGGLTREMDKAEIYKNLTAAFEEIPFAIGINNHMGSLLTQLEAPMGWIMEFLKERNVMFIDSATSSDSKAEFIAKNLGVPSMHRHVFLDNQLSQAYITKQFKLLIAKAKKNNIAIAIAHPHPETILALKKLIPLLRNENIELVSISELMSAQDKSQNKNFSLTALTE